MFRSSFEKTLETATSHLRLEPDWPSILLICDEINQKDVTPEKAFGAIKKKMNSQNPHSAYYALLVLECVVKNCGTPMHDEVFTKENCEMFSSLIESTPHDNVRDKIIELIQTWAFAFRSSEKYQAIKDTLNIVKTRGYTFPELKETDAMFTADTAPNWADGKVCHRCRVEFTFTNRKHHCRNCGQVFCGQCTAKQCALPKYGIEREVRVCDGCYAALQKPSSKVTARASDSDLPAEYLNSSLSQQVQTPPRKSDQELKEEEELQLALALSQSEAEQQKQKQQQSLANTSYRMQQPRSPSPEAQPTAKEYSQQEESNPDLAKYLNRSYWEQRKVSDSPIASPSAPSPMPATPQPQQMQPKMPDEIQIDEFAANMRTQVDIFVNRMKSNSSRGRSIANDSSVQTLFLTLTSLHSQQLAYIKELDDKRMWYEQLQDKLVQIKDSRAALDVLRQEHIEKLRRIAEEQERQRQIQMAQKLEIMRKKKQEYLQYQRQLALQKIQEQEREMQLRQEQQKAQYLMGQTTAFPFLPGAPGAPGLAAAAHSSSPSHQLNNVYNPYAFNPNASPLNASGQFNMPPPHGATIPPGMYAGIPQQGNSLGNLDSSQQMGSSNMSHFPPAGILPPGMLPPPGLTNGPMLPPGIPQPRQMPQMPDHVPNMQNQPGVPTSVAPTTQQQQQQHPSQLTHVMLQQAHVLQNQSPIPNVSAPPPTVLQTQAQIHHQQLAAAAVQQHPIPVQHQTHPQSHPQPQPQQQPPPQTQPQHQPQPQAQPQQQITPLPNNVAGDSQIQAVSSAPPPPQNDPEPSTAPSAPSAPSEPATAELISFD